jgi:hypothetical protein
MKQFFSLVLIVFLAFFLSACVTPSPATVPTVVPTSAPAPTTKAPTVAPAPIVLKLDGLSSSKSLTLDDVKALPVSQGWAGIKSSTGKITVPEQYKGVSLQALAQVVGGMGPDSGINLTAKDGYAMTISYDQITKSDFITYDPGTGDEIKITEPLTVIIAYERSGKPLDEATEGPLKLVVITAKNNQVVDGHWAVKWVKQIAVKALAQEWTLPLGGAITETMDRGTFQSCAAASCHGKTWTDATGQVWSGVPLWLLAGRVDDETKHGDGAYNQKAADQGYQVHVVAVDGFKVALDSARVNRNNNILVAYLVNNNPLDEKNFPLRLVGSDLKSNEMVGRIAKINLMMTTTMTTTAPTATDPKPTDVPKPTVPATPATSASSSGVALTITGAVSNEQKLTLDALKAMQIVTLNLEHPKTGKQDYQGVRLNALLNLANVKDTATNISMTSSDGFTAQVALMDVKKCTDCLIAFADGGKLNAAMPSMASNVWSKDVVKIEVK